MASVPPSATSGFSSVLAHSVHDHWRAFLAEGIILVILGLAAIALPFLAGLAATIYLGWVFLFAGIVGLIATFRERGMPGFGWALLSAILAIIAGGLLIWHPFKGLVTLTFILIGFFIADGVLTIILAIEHRRQLTGKWEWMLINGIIDIILAIIIIAGLPHSLVWALGLLIGIDMVFGGTTLVAMALDARKAAPANPI